MNSSGVGVCGDKDGWPENLGLLEDRLTWKEQVQCVKKRCFC